MRLFLKDHQMLVGFYVLQIFAGSVCVLALW